MAGGIEDVADETRLSQRERTASEMTHCKTRTVFHPLTSALKMNKGVHCRRDTLKRCLAHTWGKLKWANLASNIPILMSCWTYYATFNTQWIKSLPHWKDSKQKFGANQMGTARNVVPGPVTLGGPIWFSALQCNHWAWALSIKYWVTLYFDGPLQAFSWL